VAKSVNRPRGPNDDSIVIVTTRIVRIPVERIVRDQSVSQRLASQPPHLRNKDNRSSNDQLAIHAPAKSTLRAGAAAADSVLPL
jgi:hypothetical protein